MDFCSNIPQGAMGAKYPSAGSWRDTEVQTNHSPLLQVAKIARKYMRITGEAAQSQVHLTGLPKHLVLAILPTCTLFLQTDFF